MHGIVLLWTIEHDARNTIGYGKLYILHAPQYLKLQAKVDNYAEKTQPVLLQCHTTLFVSPGEVEVVGIRHLGVEVISF